MQINEKILISDFDGTMTEFDFFRGSTVPSAALLYG